MFWEALKYCGVLLLLSLIMIMEQTVALPFVTFTLFVLYIKDQQPLVMILTVGLISLLGSVLFGVSWLLLFLLLGVVAQIVRQWRQILSRTWWGLGLASLALTVIFSLTFNFAPSTQFLVFSLLSLASSLLLLWIAEIRSKRLRS